MSFLIFVYIAFLVTVTLANYKRIRTVIGMILVLFSFTSIVFYKGMIVFGSASFWYVFGKDITEDVFNILIISWYFVDLISAVLIIRSYRAYVRVNSR